jgi:hypothetical protein
MTYSKDLSKIHILKYKTHLKGQYLIPSSQILHENIDENFKIFKNIGLKMLSELKQAISTNAKIKKLSKETKISSEYLKILKRELRTYEKNVIIAFKDFPIDFLIIDKKIISKLNINGIKNTKDFYEYYYWENNEKRISENLGISIQMVKYLILLSNLVRVNGIDAFELYRIRNIV